MENKTISTKVEKRKKKTTSKSLWRKKSRVLLKFKRRLFKHIWFVRGLIIAGFISLIYLLILLAGFTLRTTGADYYLQLGSDFVFTPMEKIKSFDNRTNILVLGRGGSDHEAPDLTDTMMLVSVNHETSEITMISLPRDIWIPELRAKLNSTYYWGNKKQPGGGSVLTKSVVEGIVGIPIHYTLVGDFSVFEKIIDELDGIQVDVATAFTDTKYPIKGKEEDECLSAQSDTSVRTSGVDLEYLCRYETIIFEEGVQAMDSEIALKFVRSRNAEGDEGTDFARSVRQQLVIWGIKEKVLSREVLFSPTKIRLLFDLIMENTETDLDMPAIAVLARRIYEGKENLSNNVIPEELLVNPPLVARYDKLYVFIPRTESVEGAFDWSEVHEWIQCVLDGGECEVKEKLDVFVL